MRDPVVVTLTVGLVLPGTENEVDVEVDLTIDPGIPARTGGPPDSWDPGEPASFEIHGARVDGREVHVGDDDRTYDRIYDAIDAYLSTGEDYDAHLDEWDE